MSPGWDRDNVVGNRTELSKPDVGIPPFQAAPAIYPFLHESKSEEVGVGKKSRKSPQKSSLRELDAIESRTTAGGDRVNLLSTIITTYFCLFLFLLRWHCQVIDSILGSGDSWDGCDRKSGSRREGGIEKVSASGLEGRLGILQYKIENLFGAYQLLQAR